VRENLRFFADMRGGRDGIDGAIARWGLAPDADRPVERLSAGQRRRAALARLDAERCSLALLDEPFAELDDAAVALLRATIARERDRGTAVLVASHGHTELDSAAERVYVLRDGCAE
jgi:heme exporter protein A